MDRFYRFRSRSISAAQAPGIVSSAGELLYLSRADIERLGLSMARIVEVVEDALVQKGSGNVEMPPKPGIHTQPDAFIHAMPAYIRTTGAAGLKWVGGYPGNSARGLAYITGLMILNDPESGVPLAVMDATWITAVRTGAATAVAARHLARRDSLTAAILGCGVQGRSNLEALTVVLPDLRDVRVYDTRLETAHSFARECGQRHGLSCTVCASPRQAVQTADVVVTAGPMPRPPAPVIEPGWLADGVFVCVLDFDCYVTPAAFHAADLLATDDVAQLDYYRGVGYFAGLPDRLSDLGDVVRGRGGRRREEQRIMSINLGLGVEDVATAQLIYTNALKQGLGTSLPL